MNPILALNDRVFLLLNAQTNAPHADVIAATFLASDAIALVPLLLLALWIWGAASRRAELVSTAVAAVLALGANQIVGQFWYEPRPFMVGLGRTLLAHAPENSFPSDHTTFILTVGIALITTGAARRWGAAVCVLGVLVGWARIYLGVHFPIDIMTSAIIAMLFAAIAVVISTPIRRWFAPVANEQYDRVLDYMRLPPRLFPRRTTPN